MERRQQEVEEDDRLEALKAKAASVIAEAEKKKMFPHEVKPKTERERDAEYRLRFPNAYPKTPQKHWGRIR